VPTPQELQAAAAAAAQYTQTAEQAAMLNAAYRANQLPVLPQYGTGSGITREQYEDAQNEAIKHQIAFSQPRNDVRQLSGEAARISQEYAASRNRVVTGGGVSYQGPAQQYNPYGDGNAAAIAWEVGRTGGATDYQMNLIAEREVVAAGGDPGFIRYATDIYQERPQFEREILTTREGQQFENKEWYGVPIRMNLTKAEMAAGGGITQDNYGKFLRYDTESYQLNRLSEPTTQFGIDTGVHKARGDFGGPWLKDGAYGGWRSGGGGPGNIKGSTLVAREGSLTDIAASETTAKQPFVSARYKPPASKEYEPSGFLGLGGLIPKVSKERWSAYVTASKADPFGSALRMQSAMVAPAVAVAGGVASKITFGLSEFAYKPATDEWGGFVEGSGKVARAATGMTLAKQEAYFDTIRNEPGIFGEAKRGVFYFGTEIVNKPAELAPAALTGFGISKVAVGAPGFLARVGEGTGITARAARFVQTPGGTSLVKAGAAGVFGGAYAWGVTEGLSASPEKTKENIYRSGPTLAAMYGGAGGLNWVGETRFVRGGSTPTGATFSGVQIQNTYLGGGRTPSGGKYAGAFSPTESYVITGKPQPATSRARPMELPDLRPKKSVFVDADIGGDWVKPAQLPDYATPMETRSQSAGGLYARPESVRDMTWDRPLVERNAKGYAPSDVTNKLPMEEFYAKTTRPKGKSIEQIQADVFFGTKEPFYEISDTGVFQLQTQLSKEPEPYNPLNPKRVYAEPTPISDSTKRMFEDIHISGVPDRVVQAELAKINRGFFDNPRSRGYGTLIEREYPYTRIEQQARQRERDRGFAFAVPTFSSGSMVDTRKADQTISKLSERKRMDTIITPWDSTRTVPTAKIPGITDIMTPWTRLTTPTTPFITPTRMPTPTPFSPPSPAPTPTPVETPRRQPPYNPPPTRIIEPPRPPYEPPFAPPTGGWGFGGGGSRQYGNLGVTQWRRENLVADMPYLSRGMRSISIGMDIGSGSEKWFGGKKKRRKSKKK
jgi:hypothetical protein